VDVKVEQTAGPWYGASGAYTTSTALLDALQEAGVTHFFVNFGSDHPGLVECLAEARAMGRLMPRVITCPNEMVALSAAHGFAQVTGRPQAVIVHVECGTQSLGGAVHNAAKGRVPVFIFAGASPGTQEGECKGSRNEFIQWIQDVHDQRGLVRGYMRYDNEIRSGANVKQLVHRAMQLARSDPQGPVYLMGAREVMEADAPRVEIHPDHWQPLSPAALAPEAAAELTRALADARVPLVVTSYVGRNLAAVAELVRFCNRLGVGVLESAPSRVNFPHDNPLYRGNQWNEAQQNAALAEADVVLVIDSDVPWIPQLSRPRDGARIYHIDVDPLKAQMPLWYIPALRQYAADALTALRQLNAALDGMTTHTALAPERGRRHASRHQTRAQELARREARDQGLTAEFVTACVRRRFDADTLIFNEGISNYQTIFNHLQPTRPGSLFTSGGGSLGWHGGAALGGKLAHPDMTVIALTGDGSYMFSVPSSVHWMARRYGVPFLTVIYNNCGWKSPKLSALALHPDGHASRAGDLNVGFDPQPDYGGIAAAAGGAFAAVATTCDEFEAALDNALHAVREECRAAVLDARLARL
jgi:acetolactate synthase-1/2/3 large subunit